MNVAPVSFLILSCFLIGLAMFFYELSLLIGYYSLNYLPGI
jgi:hypothetical protein